MSEAGDEGEFDILSEPKVGYIKTYPVEFGGRRWWLTEEEMNHFKLIQQYFPSWETEVYKRMNTLSLGEIDRDSYLQAKIKQVGR